MYRLALRSPRAPPRYLVVPSISILAKPFLARGMTRTSSSWPTAEGLLDVTEEIKIDHDNVRDLFERFKESASVEDKRAIANTLIREMTIHGDAEEVTVYNDYSNLDLKNTVIHNKEEHAEIKELMFKAEHTAMSNEHFDDVITEAVHTFLAHAKVEEAKQHPVLREKLSPEDNDKIARAFLKAREKVPFRPHPLAPQSGGNLQRLVGAEGHAQDKIVEQVQDRKYVPLERSHPRP